MNDLALWVIGWGDNQKLSDRLHSWGGIPNVFTYCNKYQGESQNYNHCIKESEKLGFKYILITDSDVEFLYSETIPKMYEFISQHPEAGSIRPWRKGEPAQSMGEVDVKYIDDGTAMMWRIGIGAYYDEELVYTGWSDLDYGNELEYSGYKNYNDRRYPVRHIMDGSNSHSKSPTLQAIKKRNKLLYETKWYIVGRDKWQGVEAYNQSVSIEKRIPSANEIICWSPEDAERWQQNVSPEHQNIWVKDGHQNPNFEWLDPFIVGYSTREQFERIHGYS